MIIFIKYTFEKEGVVTTNNIDTGVESAFETANLVFFKLLIVKKLFYKWNNQLNKTLIGKSKLSKIDIVK